MPLKSYGVLKGRVKAKHVSARNHPHYHLWITANGLDYRAAVNVRSMLQPSEMEYALQFRFQHPITGQLAALEPGFHPVESCPGPGSLALDFIRLNLFDHHQMLTLPCDGPGCGADLNDVLNGIVGAAIVDPAAWVYVYGEPWGAAEASDRVFRFVPSRGMHEVHMNQGNDPAHWQQDGVWQDGAILIEHPAQRRWTGIFMKFQSQSWHTDDATGHPLAPATPGESAAPGVPLDRFGNPHPDGMVRIVAAMVRPGCSPKGREKSKCKSVTLLNVCPFSVDLTGWSLADRTKRKWRLRGTLAPGEAREIPLGASVLLGHEGGILTLLNREGLKVHGVSYTAGQAAHAGWRVVF